ncbi:MAG TPA: hypothetical protein VLM79_19830 [Kofleriaceae bacterium]|nr:hypothetical protein [Kofleriaceae bacterium]
MEERQLTFIDTDENSLVLWLKEDRVQLRVVDSRPELEAGELRAFASVLFAAYVGGPLAARIEAACAQLAAVGDQLAASGAEAHAAAMTGPLGAIREVAAAFAGVRAAIAPAPEKAPDPAPAASRPAPSRASAPPRKRRGQRAGEGDPPAWGWGRAEPPVTSSSCRRR